VAQAAPRRIAIRSRRRWSGDMRGTIADLRFSVDNCAPLTAATNNPWCCDSGHAPLLLDRVTLR
jgi:hypothetical protein